MLFFFRPPNAIIFLFVWFDNILKLQTFKKLLDFLVKNKGAKNIHSAPCFSLTLICGRLCAEPKIKKFLGLPVIRFIFLLKDGI